MEEDNLPSSQLAYSHQPPGPSTPRPAKRPRTNPPIENAVDVIWVDDDVPLSQVSPSRPPRPPKAPQQPLLYVLSDSDEDEIVQVPLQQSWMPHQSRVSGKRNSEELQPKGQFADSRAGHGLRQSKPEQKRRTPSKDELQTDQRNNDTASAVAIPDDFEFPSPPPSSSDERDGEHPRSAIHPYGSNKAHEKRSALNGSAEEATVAPPAKPKVTDSFDPSICSQDSAYFSFSREGTAKAGNEVLLKEHIEVSVKADSDQVEPTKDSPTREPYYSKAFDYVLTQVLARYADILRPCEVDLATSMKRDLSRDGLALFVRIYRRKQPQWYRTAHLHTSYGNDIDVDSGVVELGARGLVISSVHAAKGGKKVTHLVARELLRGLRAPELKAVLWSVSDANSLKKLNTRKLVPALQGILMEKSHHKEKKKLKQATLTGLSQADCLSRAILKRAGHSIKIPGHVLEQLQRIHFLFFLEDGHDSPNVILADTGKAKFPNYECRNDGRIFPSAYAFEDYESAISLENQLNHALEHKDNLKAAHYGSMAELEVREHLAKEPTDDPDASSENLMRYSSAYSSTGNARLGSLRSPRRKRLDKHETSTQLRHPFFRRYTAHWVYVRIAWHSVTALERLGEFEVAVQRLKLLLSTGLMPRRRGKCLNRLTINLYKHLERPEEALEAILSALQQDSPLLHFGDRIALANRGIAIHKKLALPSAVEAASESFQKRADRKKAALADVTRSRPAVLKDVISETEATVTVRKIYGKSLQISGRERRRRLQERERDPWEVFKGENSRDSIASNTTQDSSVLGKSKYNSHGSADVVVSVENFCLEWYHGKEGWSGVHDEGNAIRFLYCLLFWECALFAPVDDVFQTPYQDRPLDLYTEAFYSSRKERIDERLATIASMESCVLRDEVLLLYTKYESVRAIGCDWKTYTALDLSHIAAGLGGLILSHCCKLLSIDYAYWGGGLPDLTLWRVTVTSSQERFNTRLVEVKSPRDNLSERQRAWLLELTRKSADCEVCKVVEKVTERNAAELESSSLDAMELTAIDDAIGGEES